MTADMSRLYICLSRFMAYPAEVPRGELEECLAYMKAAGLGQAVEAASEILDNMSWALEHYVELFELSPSCPPYLGHYAAADDQARRLFMVEMAQWYKRFGLRIKGGELPDYLPAVVEFLGLTAGVRPAERGIFISRFLRPHLPKFLRCLEENSRIYYRLYKAFEDLLHGEFPHGVAMPKLTVRV